jgi:hemoglobin
MIGRRAIRSRARARSSGKAAIKRADLKISDKAGVGRRERTCRLVLNGFNPLFKETKRMRSVKTFLTAACLVGLMAAGAAAQNTNSSTTMAAAPQKSLYERLGGLEAITAVIDEFIKNLAGDERINKKLAKSGMNVPRVRLHLIEQVCEATGGPCKYTGLSMKKSHKNMGVTEGEFNAGVEDLVKALDKFNVPAAEKNELLGILGSLKGDIVEVNSPATGTPLPDKFKPAKPASQKEIDAGPTMKRRG